MSVLFWEFVWGNESTFFIMACVRWTGSNPQVTFRLTKSGVSISNLHESISNILVVGAMTFLLTSSKCLRFRAKCWFLCWCRCRWSQIGLGEVLEFQKGSGHHYSLGLSHIYHHLSLLKGRPHLPEITSVKHSNSLRSLLSVEDKTVSSA